MPNPTLTLRRQGQFTARTVPGTPHCGTSDTLRVNYRVVITCTLESLDSKGFLFDQLNVARYFATITRVDQSCEALCLKASRDLYRLIMAENGSCQVMAVSIELSPEPFAASMTFDWRRE